MPFCESKNTIELPPSLLILHEQMNMLEIAENKPDNNQHMSIGNRLLRQRPQPTDDSDKNSSIRQINRRTIQRPRRISSTLNTTSDEDDINLAKNIKKIYTDQKVGRLKMSNLETIFEESNESETDVDGTKSSECIFGGRKIQRSLKFPDHFRITKTMKEKRRRRVKRFFGSTRTFKKIAFKHFMKHLNETSEEPSPSLEPIISEENICAV